MWPFKTKNAEKAASPEQDVEKLLKEFREDFGKDIHGEKETLILGGKKSEFFTSAAEHITRQMAEKDGVPVIAFYLFSHMDEDGEKRNIVLCKVRDGTTHDDLLKAHQNFFYAIARFASSAEKAKSKETEVRP